MDSSAVRMEEGRPAEAWQRALVQAVLRGWKVLLAFAVAGGAIGVLLGLALPSWYDTTVELALVPVDDPTTPALTSSVENATVELPLLAQILQSRKVADEAGERLDLARIYGVSTAEQLRRELARHMRITADKKANTITVWVEDRDSTRARELAHILAQAGERESGLIWSARSREHRRRLEDRLDVVGRELTSAQQAMRQFRELNHVVDLDTQVKSSVAEAALIEHLKIEKRLALHFARGYASSDSPEVKTAAHEAAGARNVLAALVHGATPGKRGPGGPLLALDDLPAIEQENERLKLAVEVSSASYALLARQVEQLRAVEARPVGHAEVVDPPVASFRRARPARGMLAAEGMMIGLLLGAAAILVRTWRRSVSFRALSA